MLASIVRFADDSAGIEKSLRMLQGLSQTAAGFAISDDAARPWRQARRQFALGRRYFRVFKWYPCWTLAYQRFNKDQAALLKLLEVTQYSCLGLYYFLEVPTYSNTMGVTSYDWGPRLEVEANKFWVYAIVFSIFVSLYQIVQGYGETNTSAAATETTTPDSKTEKPSTESKPTPSHAIPHSKLYKQLIIDGCDLLIAGSSVGWILADELTVGTAYIVSSALAGTDIWNRVQAKYAVKVKDTNMP